MKNRKSPSHQVLNFLTKTGPVEYPRHKDGNRLGIRKRIATAILKPVTKA